MARDAAVSACPGPDNATGPVLTSERLNRPGIQRQRDEADRPLRQGRYRQVDDLGEPLGRTRRERAIGPPGRLRPQARLDTDADAWRTAAHRARPGARTRRGGRRARGRSQDRVRRSPVRRSRRARARDRVRGPGDHRDLPAPRGARRARGRRDRLRRPRGCGLRRLCHAHARGLRRGGLPRQLGRG